MRPSGRVQSLAGEIFMNDVQRQAAAGSQRQRAVAGPTKSIELGRLLERCRRDEKARIDRERAEALAKLRDVARFD